MSEEQRRHATDNRQVSKCQTTIPGSTHTRAQPTNTPVENWRAQELTRPKNRRMKERRNNGTKERTNEGTNDAARNEARKERSTEGTNDAARDEARRNEARRNEQQQPAAIPNTGNSCPETNQPIKRHCDPVHQSQHGVQVAGQIRNSGFSMVRTLTLLPFLTHQRGASLKSFC